MISTGSFSSPPFPNSLSLLSLSLSLTRRETQKPEKKSMKMVGLQNWAQPPQFISFKLLMSWYFNFFNEVRPFFLLNFLGLLSSYLLVIELCKFYSKIPKTASLLILVRDGIYKPTGILNLSDDNEVSSIWRIIKFNVSYFGELRTACRVWKDYCATRDAVVYIVNADTRRNMEQVLEARRELHALLSDEEFAIVPLLIFCMTEEPSSASENELCSLLGLSDKTTGKGRVTLSGNARPLEVFMVEPHNLNQYLNAIEWLSQYVKK
ncbi:GTP-binding protein SAR1A-like isoform X2 [Quercus lobata]|uniref:GTP-binding protein SAR1A-like isoform X2 n=1 Tax=Quercus lobata TaxID=97700 RepID=UPI0012467765|nr:GTP-binding protein SAR1A-like isoform X2 [Quercus lobata]